MNSELVESNNSIEDFLYELGNTTSVPCTPDVTPIDPPQSTSTTIAPIIFNLSGYQLSSSDNKLLRRGLKFTPTPLRRNDTSYVSSIDDFCQRLKWSYHWNGKPQDNSKKSIITKPSAKRCPASSNETFEECMRNIRTTKFHYKGTIKRNMPKLQYRSINILKETPEITIKEADKGSGVVILNTAFYTDKIEMMLSDPTTYSRSEITRETLTNKVSNFIDRHKNLLTPGEHRALTHFDGDLAYLYGLPKIHKSTLIKYSIADQLSETILLENPDDLTFRPIVSCTKCPLSKPNELLDKLLRPFLQHLNYRIQDSWELLRKLPSSVPTDCRVTTADISSLYTNVSHHAGICAITYFLDTYPDLIHPRINKEFVLDLLNFCLHNSFFTFNKHCYHQRWGCPMGAKFSPTYCDLKVGYDELNLAIKIRDTFQNDIAEFVLDSYYRYLDDVVIFWRDSYGDFGIIITMFDTLDDNLTFIFDPLLCSANFLDITITISQGSINTDIFHKDTDTFNYVPYKSNHPKHTKNNIPYCLARRICGIVSEDNTRTLRLGQMASRLAAKGYPKSVIRKGIEMATSLDRNDIINPQLTPSTQNKTKQTIALVSTFHPSYVSPIKEINHIVKNSRQQVPFMKDINVINSYRQTPSLKLTLTLSNNNSTEEPTVYKCNRPRCKCCLQLITGNQTKLKNGRTIRPNKSMTCTDYNLIYILICEGCKEYYIGECDIKVSIRMNLHRDHSKPNPNCSALNCDKHFRFCAGGNFSISFIHKMAPGCSLSSRKAMEQKLINIFKPKLNTD